MKIIVGLGNPGAAYERTRHNVGYMVIDHLAARCAPGETAKVKYKSLAFEARLPMPSDNNTLPSDLTAGLRCLMLKPITFMNLSGQAVAESVRFYKLDPEADVLVIVDDVALPCGSLRLREKGGAGGHNGLGNIQQLLGTQKYARLRIGIDPPGRVPQKDYVLGKFSPEQQTAIDRIIPTAAAACAVWAHDGGIAAMNRFNAGDEPKPKPRSSPSAESAPPDARGHDGEPPPTSSTDASPQSGAVSSAKP